MKSKILWLFAAVLSMSLLTSCHDDATVKPVTEGDGTVNLRSLAVEVDNAEKVIASSRANIDLSDFVVQIFNASNQKVAQWTYASMPEVFTLAAGAYRVHVYSHDVKKAEWEHPYFVGDREFTVVSDKITDIGIVTCKLANIKVSIRYTAELRKYMGDDCKVTVIANDEGRLEFLPDEVRSGYFAALEGSSTLVAEFTGTVGGHMESLRHVCADVAAGQHRIITFKLRKSDQGNPDEDGYIDIDGGVVLDASTQDEDLTGNVNVGEDNLGDEDRPGGEEGGGEEPGPGPAQPEEPDVNAPYFVAEGADFDNPANPVSDHVVVYIHAPNGLAHLVVNIESDNANFIASAGELLPLTFDLAYPGESGEALASIGLPVGNDVIDKTEVPFDISQLVPLLNAFPGTHSFTISVTDNKQLQLVKTLRIKS